MKKMYLLMCMCFVVISGIKSAPNTDLKPIKIVFESIKSNYDTITFKDGVDAITSNSILSVRLSAENSIHLPIKDTLTIQPKLGYIIVNHRYSPTSSIDFLLQPGDIAHLKYIKEVPFVTITNRDVKLFDINYDYYKRQRYTLNEDMQSIDILNSPASLVFKKLIKGEKTTSLKVLEEIKLIVITELNNEKIWLDSIYQSGQISDKEYHFYKDRNHYLSLNQSLKTKSLEELTVCLKEYNDSLYGNDFAGFYKGHFYKVGFTYLNAVFPTVKIKLTETYDYIEHTTALSGKLSQDMKFMILRNIMYNSPAEVRIKYFNKFSQSVSDTAFIAYLKKEYESLINPHLTKSLDVELLDCFGQKTNLLTVLKQCKGKTVYADFWASWCVPCLKEMPISKKLREDPANQNVTFIYLALNDTQDQWKSCWKKAGLESYRYNYLVLNSKDAPFVKQNKVSTIPRFMIFDQKGILLNTDAPRPSDNNIQNVLKSIKQP